MLDSDAQYWDSIWSKRIYQDKPKVVDMNKLKMKRVLIELMIRPYYRDLNKLDVGGGTGIHHGIMDKEMPGWANNLAIVDCSEVAVAKARLFNINAYLGDFYEFDPGRKFDAFFFLDSLEHFEDLRKVSHKITYLANGDFYVFGNVPLYSQAHQDHEWPMDRTILTGFLWSLGMDSWRQFVYGSYGYPYMIFEARLNHDVPDFDGRMERIRMVE
jgi:hypothetical protein